MALIVPHFNLHLLFRMGRLLMKSTALIEQAGGESRQLGKSRRSGLSRLKIIGEQAVNQVLGFISTILLFSSDRSSRRSNVCLSVRVKFV